MVRIVDRSESDSEGTLYGSTDEAEHALDTIIKTFKNIGRSIEVRKFDDDPYPLYIVKGRNDLCFGTYTIEL